MNHRGQRRSKRVGNRAVAEQAADQIRARLTLGKRPFIERKEALPGPTVEEYWKRFKRTYLVVAVKPKTLRTYHSNFETHLLPRFGERRLDQVSRQDVEQMIAELFEAGKARDTIRLAVASLRRLYSHAVEHGLIRDNPASGHGKMYRNAKRKHDEIQPLDAPEVIALLKSTRKHFPYYYPLLLAAIHTGMRSGELAALQWGDIDWRKGRITVRRNLVEGNLQTTKTGRIRTVDMSDELATVLRDSKKRRREEYLKKGANEIPQWVFPTPAGDCQTFHNLRRREFKLALEKAKLRKIRFHDLRHTFATLLIMQGESLAYVRDQMGHKNIQVTVNTYTHWIPSSNRQAVNRLPTTDSPVNEVEKAAGAI